MFWFWQLTKMSLKLVLRLVTNRGADVKVLHKAVSLATRCQWECKMWLILLLRFPWDNEKMGCSGCGSIMGGYQGFVKDVALGESHYFMDVFGDEGSRITSIDENPF